MSNTDKVLWRHGTGTPYVPSPLLAGDRLFFAQRNDALLTSLDVRTGKKIWETPRREARGSFGTPIIWHNSAQDEIITPGSIRIQGYDLKTGKERWKVEPVAAFVCTTPVSGDGMLFFAAWSPGKNDSPWPNWASFLEKNDKNKDGEVTFDEFDASNRDFARGMDFNRDGKITSADWDLIQAYTAKSENVLVAVKPGGTGDISQTHVAWKLTRGLPYVASPLFYDGRLYLAKDGGMISSLDAKTGKPFYLQERIDAVGSYYSSPVAADGRIYVASVPGKLTVFKAGGDKPEILHQAEFKERIFATPAPVGNNLYLRTANHLWAF